MKYLKILSLMAIAVTALAAFAATASATTLTSPKGTVYTGEITAVNEGGPAKLVGPLGIEVECESHVAGTITKNTGSGEVEGTISTLSFTPCLNGYKVTVKKSGTLSVNSAGAVKSSGAEVTVETPIFGISCTYSTAGTAIGTLTDSTTTGATATFDISATLSRTGDSGLCGSTGTWSGHYLVSKPDSLFLD
jgi:hypothetical protein